MEGRVPVRCLVRIDNEASMYTFVSVPLIGDWVHMPSGDSLAIYVVSEVTHVPQPAEDSDQKARSQLCA